MSTDTAARWLARFEHLRVDVDAVKGRAPHKPLLLLAVLELIEAGRIMDGWVHLDAELVLRFQNVWPIVQMRRGNKGVVPE